MDANKDNRKVYDKKFLLSLRHAPGSTKKPDNLPVDLLAGHLTRNDMQMKIFKARAESLLNTLTQDNLYTLLNDLENLHIDTHSKIHLIIDLIFEKVIDQDDFSTKAAALCKEFCSRMYISEDEEEVLNIRGIFVSRCKFALEQNLLTKMERFKKTEEIEKCQDLDYKENLKEKLKEYDHNSKQELLKFSKFIGEVFNNDLILFSTMKHLLTELFKRRDENSIACLCTLLATINYKLDKTNPKLASFLSDLQVFVEENEYDVELRNMVQDITADITDIHEVKYRKKRNGGDEYYVKLDQKLKTNNNEIHAAEHQETAGATSKLYNDELSCHQFRAKQVLKEYVDNDRYSIEKCKSNIEMVLADLNHSQLVFEGCMLALEISKAARLRIGFLFNHLIRLGTITLKDYCAGLHNVLKEADDLSVDIQNIWEYVAELVVPITHDDDSKSVKIMYKLIKFLSNKNGGTKLLTYMFKLIIQEKGMPEIAECINKLEIINIKSSNSISLPASKKISISSSHNHSYKHVELFYDDVEKKILSFFESDVSFEEINEWVLNLGNVNKTFVKDKFIKVFATACFKNSVNDLKLERNLLEKRNNLLIDFIDGDSDKEMQCLHALQAFVHELNNPEAKVGSFVIDKIHMVQVSHMLKAGSILKTNLLLIRNFIMVHKMRLLFDICEQLYENNVISYKSFLAWEKNADPSERKGKVEALEQLSEFLSLLKVSYEDDIM